MGYEIGDQRKGLTGMAGTPIPEWDYESYPDDETRHNRCVEILVDLSQGRVCARESAREPRPIHLRMFAGMHEPSESYYVGHYRGEPIGDLAHYDVGVGQDARVGVYHIHVLAEMLRFHNEVDQTFSTIIPTINAVKDAQVRLTLAVGVACTHLVDFLSIHPFANGNGHIGRYIVWAVLHAFGIHPKRWPLNDKIPEPYGTLLTEFRNKNRSPLIRFVLSHI